jgi:hypothetical protein
MQTLIRLACLVALAGSTMAWAQDNGVDARDDAEERIQRLIRERRQQEEAQTRAPITLDNGASINPRLLEVVKDTTIGLRYEEKSAYFRILKLAQKVPLPQQKDAAADFQELRRLGNERYAKRKPSEFPTFVDMFQYPDEYRGHPVTLHGVIRKLTKFDPGENSQGIGEIYEGWIYTDDSQANPAVVVFSSKPEGLEVGGDLAEEVRVTGYFFKMYGYEAQDVTRKAPLLLAGEIEWRPGVEPYKPQSLPLEVYFLITLVVLLLVFVMWQANRRDAASRVHPQVGTDFNQLPPMEISIGDPVERKPHVTEPNDS